MKMRKNSLCFKLWRCFFVLLAATLLLLWLLQVVFLQSFYRAMQKRALEKAAEQIEELVQTQRGYDEIAAIAYDGSLQVILTDFEGDLLYSADEYSAAYQKHETAVSPSQNPYREGETLNWQLGLYRNLPEEHSNFLRTLAASSNGCVCYALDSGTGKTDWIYGKIIETANGEALALYLHAPAEAVKSTVAILRTILLTVTALALAAGFALAYWFAQKLSRPIAELAKQAKKMSNGAETVSFSAGFCTELDQLAATLEAASQSLAKLELARRELLANITHDLRTPLTLIGGYAEKIEDISCRSPEEARADAAVILRETRRLSLLVNDILDASALGAAAVKLELQPLDLSALTGKVIGQFGVFCERGELLITQSIAPSLFVLADEARLAQVLYNLIANAAVHVGADKTIEVAVYAASGCVQAEIRDHGSGIDPETAEHIWDRYYTSRERKRSELGTGLGLAIVKDLLTLHGAQYGVRSTPGCGSCFWFRLAQFSPET